MHRLERYNSLILSAIASKSQNFKSRSIKFNSLSLVAGLYKPSSLTLEHGLILTSIAGTPAIARAQLHGKRQKRTVSLTAISNNRRIWQTIDKVTNELLPRVSDFRTPKFNKPGFPTYTLRVKQKFTPLADFEDLISSDLYDGHKGIFLPLSVHINFIEQPAHSTCEHYLRMLRLPFSFYVKRTSPAFDDSAIFQA